MLECFKWEVKVNRNDITSISTSLTTNSNSNDPAMTSSTSVTSSTTTNGTPSDLLKRLINIIIVVIVTINMKSSIPQPSDLRVGVIKTRSTKRFCMSPHSLEIPSAQIVEKRERERERRGKKINWRRLRWVHMEGSYYTAVFCLVIIVERGVRMTGRWKLQCKNIEHERNCVEW